MWDIRESLLPVFIFGYTTVVLTHAFGLILLCTVKFKPANQRTILIHLALTEMSIGLSQTVIYTLMFNSKCGEKCGYTDHFFYLFFTVASQVIMLYLICDRLLEIQLNIKYPLYFSNGRVNRILVAVWMVSGFYSLIVIVFDRYDVGPQRLREILESCVLIGLDFIIIFTALVSYIFLYNKVKRIVADEDKQKRTQNTNNDRFTNNSIKKRGHTSKFLLPTLIVATYLLFNVSGNTIYYYKHYALQKGTSRTLLSEVSHLLLILGWLTDVILCIFLQGSIKHRLQSLFRRHSPPNIHSPLILLKNIYHPVMNNTIESNLLV